MLRFSLRRLLVAMALVALALGLGPVLYVEMLWRKPRAELESWAPQIHRSDEARYIHHVVVSGRFYGIMTIPAHYMPKGRNGTVTFDLPTDAGIEMESPYGPNAGFFITPQCVWVETVDDAIATWKTTTDQDWRRYESLHPLRRQTPNVQPPTPN